MNEAGDAVVQIDRKRFGGRSKRMGSAFANARGGGDQGNRVALRRWREYAAKVLECVVVGDIVGVARAMVTPRKSARTATAFRQHQRPCARVRTITIQQGKDVAHLGNEAQSGQPRNAATHCLQREHSTPRVAVKPIYMTRDTRAN